jgi:hypothetical protein
MVMPYLDDGEAGPGARAHRHGAHPNGSVREGPGQRGVRAPNMGHGTWEGRGRDSALPGYGPFPRARSRVLVGWRAGGLADGWTVDCGLVGWSGWCTQQGAILAAAMRSGLEACLGLGDANSLLPWLCCPAATCCQKRDRAPPSCNDAPVRSLTGDRLPVTCPLAQSRGVLTWWMACCQGRRLGGMPQGKRPGP